MSIRDLGIIEIAIFLVLLVDFLIFFMFFIIMRHKQRKYGKEDLSRRQNEMEMALERKLARTESEQKQRTERSSRHLPNKRSGMSVEQDSRSIGKKNSQDVRFTERNPQNRYSAEQRDRMEQRQRREDRTKESYKGTIDRTDIERNDILQGKNRVSTRNQQENFSVREDLQKASEKEQRLTQAENQNLTRAKRDDLAETENNRRYTERTNTEQRKDWQEREQEERQNVARARRDDLAETETDCRYTERTNTEQRKDWQERDQEERQNVARARRDDSEETETDREYLAENQQRYMTDNIGQQENQRADRLEENNIPSADWKGGFSEETIRNKYSEEIDMEQEDRLQNRELEELDQEENRRYKLNTNREKEDNWQVTEQEKSYIQERNKQDDLSEEDFYKYSKEQADHRQNYNHEIDFEWENDRSSANVKQRDNRKARQEYSPEIRRQYVMEAGQDWETGEDLEERTGEVYYVSDGRRQERNTDAMRLQEEEMLRMWDTNSKSVRTVKKRRQEEPIFVEERRISHRRDQLKRMEEAKLR